MDHFALDQCWVESVFVCKRDGMVGWVGIDGGSRTFYTSHWGLEGFELIGWIAYMAQLGNIGIMTRQANCDHTIYTIQCPARYLFS